MNAREGLRAQLPALLSLTAYTFFLQSLDGVQRPHVKQEFGPDESGIAFLMGVVQLGGFGVRIIEECTGIFEAIIFVAAVLAFPTSLARKAIGVALGVPLLYVVNVLRILVLLVVGSSWPAVFEFMHLYFWQATLILMITSVWLLWIFKVVRHGKQDLPAPR